MDPFTADSKWQLDAGGVHRTPFGQLENYDVFSADHTSTYGYPMGHPLRGFDITEDTERGGVTGIARRKLAPNDDNITWSRPSNACLCSCFRGSVTSVQVSFHYENYLCVLVGTAVSTFTSQWERPTLSQELLYVRPYLCVRTHACDVHLIDRYGFGIWYTHVPNACIENMYVRYLLSIH